MLKLGYIEVILRLIPEAYLFVFSGYALSKIAVNKRRHLLSTLVLAFVAYLIRLLPIHYGVHTILSLIVLIILLVSINRIDIVRAISAATIIFILGFITEGITVFLLQNVFNLDTSSIFADPLLKTVYGTPALVILGVIVSSYYGILLKLNKLKKV